jgi:hypothetical protein
MKVQFNVTRRRVAVTAAVLALGTVGIGYAAIPGSGGVISGCRDVNTGVLRVIDAEAGETCRGREAALTWNQTGPPGPPGADGSDGAPGTAAAYARIGSDGTVNADFASGISSANVSHPAPGIYCLRNLGFQPRAVVATGPAGLMSDGAGGIAPAQFDTNVTASILLLSLDAFLAFCDTDTTPAADRASVRIYVSSPNGLVDRSFTVLLED